MAYDLVILHPSEQSYTKAMSFWSCRGWVGTGGFIYAQSCHIPTGDGRSWAPALLHPVGNFGDCVMLGFSTHSTYS